MPVTTQWMLGNAVEKEAPHHKSIEALWNLKWREPVSIAQQFYVLTSLRYFQQVQTWSLSIS